MLFLRFYTEGVSTLVHFYFTFSLMVLFWIDFFKKYSMIVLIKIHRMKKVIFCCIALFTSTFSIQAQDEKDKDVIKVDIENGIINGLKPSATMADVKKTMPFYTGETPENQGINCDGGIFYMNNDIYFYTARHYVEIRSQFDGKLSKDILNKNIQEITKLLGEPDHQIKPAGDDESIMVLYFKTSYGCLRINYTIATGNIFEIGIHPKPINEAMLDLCF